MESTPVSIDPLVTCLMVTGKDPYRRPLAERAVQCFHNQSYPNRELVVVNVATDAPWFPGTAGVTEIPVKPGPTLGGLRNLGLEAARGSLWALWDDDDWHHPDRLTYQVRLRADVTAHDWAVKDMPAILRRQLVLDLYGRKWTIVDGAPWPARGISGTLLAPVAGLRFRLVDRGEDSAYIQDSPAWIVQDNAPEIYVRLYHGRNTWPRNRIIVGPANCPAAYRGLVSNILEFYGEAPL